MKNLVLVTVTLLALNAPAAHAETKCGQATPITDRVLVNSQTGAPVEGSPQILRLTHTL